MKRAAGSTSSVTRVDGDAFKVGHALVRRMPTRKLRERQAVARSEFAQRKDFGHGESPDGALGLRDMYAAILPAHQPAQVFPVIRVDAEYFCLDRSEAIEILARCEANRDSHFAAFLRIEWRPPGWHRGVAFDRASSPRRATAARRRPRSEPLSVQNRLKGGGRACKFSGCINEGAFELLDQLRRRPLIANPGLEPHSDPSGNKLGISPLGNDVAGVVRNEADAMAPPLRPSMLGTLRRGAHGAVALASASACAIWRRSSRDSTR
jgi:hypothetical protein